MHAVDHVRFLKLTFSWGEESPEVDLNMVLIFQLQGFSFFQDTNLVSIFLSQGYTVSNNNGNILQ